MGMRRAAEGGNPAAATIFSIGATNLTLPLQQPAAETPLPLAKRREEARAAWDRTLRAPLGLEGHPFQGL